MLFLPRKFKVAVSVPTDNSVDVLTNDIGVVVVTDDNGEPHAHIFLSRVGGGMERTHRMESTFPCLAEPLGYVPKEGIMYAVKSIIFEPPKELPEWELKSHLGWIEQGDGRLLCGLHVDSGRVKGIMKKTLREIIEKCNLLVRIPPNQNIVLCDIRPSWKRPITVALAQGGLLVGLLYNESIVVRVTSCPNVCARPYMAGLGLVEF
uniref:Uncharacterized protein n=1 Tax=Lactuca sativa TaxID=4236 RepID=A0A9R1VZB7_LACSA|nr:hypothetical protein LSAT_V11C300133660 [Lactuca sativa]